MLSRAPSYFPTGDVSSYIRIPPHPGQHLLLCVFLILAILVGEKWYVFVASICFLCRQMMLSIILCAYWPFVHLLWRNICPHPFQYEGF